MPIQPILKLSYIPNISTFYDKKIEILVYLSAGKLKDIFKKLQEKTNSNSSSNSKLDGEASNPKQLEQSLVSIIATIWASISGGGKLPGNIIEFNQQIKVEFSAPTQTSDNTLIFKDLKLSFVKYGDYSLVFIVDGIESIGSGIINYSEEETPFTRIFDFSDYFMVAITFFAVAISTTKFHNSLFIIGGFISIFLTIAIIPFIKKSLLWKILLSFGCGGLILTLIEIIYQLYQRKRKNSTLVISLFFN